MSSEADPAAQPNHAAPAANAASEDHDGDPAPSTAAPKPQRSALAVFCATVLALEAFVVFFATVVAIGLDLAPRPVLWSVGLWISAVFIVGAALARKPFGRVLGSILQVVLVAGGLFIPMMFFIAIVFVIVWIIALRLGRRIDTERAQRELDEQQGTAPQH